MPVTRHSAEESREGSHHRVHSMADFTAHPGSSTFPAGFQGQPAVQRMLLDDCHANQAARARLPPAPDARFPIQAMSFSRFSGLGLLTNWSYNETETALLEKERKAREAVDGLMEHFEDANRPDLEPPDSVRNLNRDLETVEDASYGADELDDAKTELDRIIREADRISSQQATLLGFDEAFAQGSPQEIPSGYELLKEIRRYLANPRLQDLPRMRLLMDAYTQWVSDAMMRVPGSPMSSFLKLKQRSAEAAAEMNTAYFTGLTRRDYQTARAKYETACIRLGTVNLSLPLAVSGAKPKAREDWHSPFDPGAMMLAAALVANRFEPHLLVGLPTGGVHAANKLAGALATKTGRTPVLWYTRPKAVKESSRAIFKGVKTEDILHDDEVDQLRGQLKAKGKRGGTLKIVIIDDGVVSGTTIALAKEFYEKAFGEHYPRILARTAVIKGGRGNEMETLPRGNANEIDFVVNQTDDRAGPRDMGEQKDVPEARTQQRGVSLGAVIDIHKPGSKETMHLSQTLTS